MSSKPSLPVEILDHTFYFLRDDIPALWVSDVDQIIDIVEKHLYHRITLRDSEMTPAHLSELLVVSPHVITYIKSLRIILSSNRSLPWLWMPFKGEDFGPILLRLLHLTIYYGVEFFSLNDFWITSDGQDTLSIEILSTPNPWITQSLSI